MTGPAILPTPAHLPPCPPCSPTRRQRRPGDVHAWRRHLSPFIPNDLAPCSRYPKLPILNRPVSSCRRPLERDSTVVLLQSRFGIARKPGGFDMLVLLA